MITGFIDQKGDHMLGYESIGSGRQGVIVLHDWLCDTSTWDSVRLFLNTDAFSWVFADMRGYGKSLELKGTYTIEETAADVIALADHLGWNRFVVVGHSMSTLVALHVAQTAASRIEKVVLVCPVPPRGMGADDAMIAALQGVAAGDDVHRAQAVKYTVGNRLCDGWIRYKVAQWRATSSPDAVRGYIFPFARDGVPNPQAMVSAPLLAVTGEQDDVPMRSDGVRGFYSPICSNLTIAPIVECGHYPMQETPPHLATLIERFLLPPESE